MFFSTSVQAHQPEISTTMLVENDNNTWIFQISASLTALQQEIKMHYTETPYKTPEEFQEMVIEYIKNNLKIVFNGNKIVTLSHGIVRLGHETKVIFEVVGVPKNIESVLIKNESFKDIYNNKSALVILKEGFNKESFVLTKDNNHVLKLKVDGNSFKRLDEEIINSSSLNIILLLAVVCTFGLLVHSINKRKQLKEANNI